jgi:glycosyltransferase involved in cell wall biosynthesis
MNERIALVIPVFNEIFGIQDTLDALDFDGQEFEVFFIDDGSTDGSAEYIQRNLKGHRQHLVQIGENRGYGAACNFGAQLVHKLGFSWVIFSDSDLTNPVSDIERMTKIIKSNQNIDFIKGNRFFSAMGLDSIELRRRRYTKVARFISRLLFSNYVSDPSNGFRAIRLDIYIGMNLTCNDFSIIMEELYYLKKRNATPFNMSTILLSRRKGQRESAFLYSRKQIWAYLRWCIRAAI